MKLRVALLLTLVGATGAGCVDLSRPTALVTDSLDARPDEGDGARQDMRLPGAGEDTQTPTAEAAPEVGAPEPDGVTGVDFGGPDATDADVSRDAMARSDLSSVDVPDAPAPEVAMPPLAALGTACTTGGTCASGRCVDGVCCNTTCADPCFTCNGSSSPGTCSPEPTGTVCAPAGCSNGFAMAPGLCSAGAQCQQAESVACSPYACGAGACARSCAGPNDCAAPFVCSGAACVSPGLLLHWRLDETGGLGVADASGNGRSGRLVGDGFGRPDFVADGAPLLFGAARSLDFNGAAEHGVVANVGIPEELKNNPELTLSAWIKTASAVLNGSEVIVLGGSDYALRVKTDQLEFLKRKSTMPGFIYALAQTNTTSHIDGKWHHIAGTSGASGMKLYLDGTEIAASANAEPPLYGDNDQIAVGHAPGSSVHYFTGRIDDARIYNRILTNAEIRNLARGNR